MRHWALFAFFSLVFIVALLFPTSQALAADPITAILDAAISSGQKTFQEGYAESYAVLSGVGCWGCSVFDSFAFSMFSAGRSVSTQSADPLRGLIVAFASLFSIVYIGQSFVSGDASDLIGKWKVFWHLMIAVTIGSMWLAGGSAFDNTWNWIYGPLLKVPMAVADAVPVAPMTSSSPTFFTPTTSCAAPTRSPSAPPSGARDVVSDMRDVVCDGHLITMKGLAFGFALLMFGDGFFSMFANILAGIAIIGIFFWVAISFPLRFIDVLLRLTVVGIVTPILVVCAVFRPTRSYVKIGVSNVLNAGCLFAFTSIMFKLGHAFFEAAVNARLHEMDKGIATMSLASSVQLVGAAIIFASMLKMAPTLASEFSQFGGQSGGVGDAATGFASSMVSLPVKGAAAATGVAGAKMVATSAGKSAAQSLGKGIKNAD